MNKIYSIFQRKIKFSEYVFEKGYDGSKLFNKIHFS